jgi:hypothetical protein
VPPAERFARGVAAYRARDYAGARDAFADVAERVPGAPDALANLGTAAWAARDTGAAVAGWQRALRLEPLAADMRANLALVPAQRRGALAYVPPVPPDAAAFVALALWVVACGAALGRAAGRWPRGRHVATAAATLAIAVGVATARVDELLAARDLAVVADRGPLRALPALSADRGATLEPGDVARVIERRGSWARVALDGDRDGWVETSRLLSVARE